MTTLDEVERAGAHVSEINAELDFSVNLCRRRLVVPGVAVPTMKVATGRQRFPALRFGQFVVGTEVSVQNLFDQRMQREIKKSLIQNEHVFDHVPKALGLLIAVKVVPTHSTQPNLERLLHAAHLFRTKKIRQDNDAVRLEFCR